MLSYNEIYELLRKEKYSETLQPIDKNFLSDFINYLSELRGKVNADNDSFYEGISDTKKQLENSISLFKGLILRRKKKLLNLVFVAAETGIMKRDYENMFDFERKMFDNLARAFEEGDKELSEIMNNRLEKSEVGHKMVIFNEDIEQFVDMNGKIVGPFGKGELVNLDQNVCEVLVAGKKAVYVDE